METNVILFSKKYHDLFVISPSPFFWIVFSEIGISTKFIKKQPFISLQLLLNHVKIKTKTKKNNFGIP